MRTSMAALATICVLVVCLTVFVDSTSRTRNWGPPGLRRWDMQSAIGASCMYDDDCASMEHTFCRYHETCQCKNGFIPSESGDRCLATVGAKCSTRFDCAGLGKSDCRQGVCDCSISFVPHPSGSLCLKTAEHLQAACEESIQCGELGATCEDGQCKCPVNQHQENNRCYENKGLGESCSDNECYVGDEYRGKILCTAGTCKCRDYFTETPDGKCTAGAGRLHSWMVLLTFITQVVIFILAMTK